MKIMICGPNGYLGAAFLAAIPDAMPCAADICCSDQVSMALDQYRPDVVINCAGKTGRPNIDWCESNKLQTARSNIAGPLTLVNECVPRDVLLVHIGSGCVFYGDNDGRGFCEHDLPNFTGSYYSRSKISADNALLEFPVLVLRLRMPFDGTEHPRGLLSRLSGYKEVLDIQNSLTYLPDFITAAKHLINQRASGVYHIVNPGTTSPFEIMQRYREIVDPAHQFRRLDANGLLSIVRAQRSNCILSTAKLEAAGLRLQSINMAVNAALHGLKGLRERRLAEARS